MASRLSECHWAPDSASIFRVVTLRLHHGTMSYIGWLGGRLLLVAVMAGGATFAGGALGGLLSGVEGRALTSNDTGTLPPPAPPICRSFLRFRTPCLGTGVAARLP